MTVPSPSDGRARTVSTTHNLNSSPSLDTLLVAPRFPTSRDPSRGRSSSTTNSPHYASPRGNPPSTPGQTKENADVGGDRGPFQPYGHHRQTSIVHGVQHSRNASLLNTMNASPLGPQRTTNPSNMEGASPLIGTESMKNPSFSALHGNTSNGSALPLNRSFESSASPGRPARMHSGRLKRRHEPQQSYSAGQAAFPYDVTTVGEYALHHLFTSFMAEADERIERCVTRPGEPEPRIENICGPGADAAFDQLLASLGHINRHKPKSLIDTVIGWRKDKANAANVIMNDLQAVKDSMSLTQQSGFSGSFSTPSSPPNGQELLSLEHKLLIADRRSGVSVYILCRVLIEIIGQTTLAALDGLDSSLNTCARLEDVIYGQLQIAEPESVFHSPVRKANWVIRGQLLGVMSGIRFEQVADRYIRDLEQAHRTLSIKGMANAKLAAKTAMLVQCMRWLKVRSHPEAAWEHSCDMLQLLAKFFTEVHGRVMKHAYAELFEHLLLSIAGSATSELNMPKWKDVLTTVQPKIAQMMSKADHWPYVFPLQAVLLCVSPADQFASQWFSLVGTSQTRIKDRSGRSHVLKAICRLVWRYLYRHDDSQIATAKRVEELIKLVFPGGKRMLVSTDPIIADPLIQLIRIVGYKHQDLCFRMIIFPFMNADLFNGPENQQKIDNLDPEKTVVAIRAFLTIMADLEKGEPPPFPTSFECDALLDPASRSPITHRRTKSQGFTVSAGRTERLSRPVVTDDFNEVAKEHYVKFCKILGQLAGMCNAAFGAQSALEEKTTTHTPKTPMAEAFTFNKRDEVTNPTESRQQYYDLFHVAVEALPRCLSSQLSINPLVNLLCTGTAHSQSHIASSSAQSLKSIARQSHAQPVAVGFARFILNFNDRYATMTYGTLLGPAYIENTLKLWVELLQIWIEEIEKRKRRTVVHSADDESTVRQTTLDPVSAVVDEVESQGLYFLCSPSRAVRTIAVNVLRLITQFDTALGTPTVRFINILEGSTEKIVEINHERLNVSERSRLRKSSTGRTSNTTLTELCNSDVAHDAILWFKIFPSIVRLSNETCFNTVAQTRQLVCNKLAHSYKIIHGLADGTKQSSNVGLELGMSYARQGGRLINSSPDAVIEQWKIHLVFACTTVTNIGSSHLTISTSSQASSQHSRKGSKSSSASQEQMASANEIFSRAVPFLSVPNPVVRNAAVVGLGATNSTLFHTLLQALQPYVMECSNEAKERVALHQRNVSNARRNRRVDCLRTEITHLLSLTCPLLRNESVVEDDYALTYLIDYAKHLRIFLSDAEVQSELEFQKLRTYFCSLTEALYDCTRILKDSTRWMSFQSRQATFSLMENWCGFSPNEAQLRQREESIRRSVLEQEQDSTRVGIINSALEKERVELQGAALSAMATLCAGSLSFVAEGRILMQFDVRRMLSWVASIFENPSDRTHAIGRRALHNLIVHNPDQSTLMSQAMRMCYMARNPKALMSYFEVVTTVLTESDTPVVPFWKTLCLALYTIGNEVSSIRVKSGRLLRILEERRTGSSKVQDLEISVSDKTRAVYKLAQFEISQRLSKQHHELAFHVFSEFSAYFNELQPDHQRNMVSAMLPWIQTIHLQTDPNGNPTAPSYMLLANLFEITVRSSIALHNEIQALWQALATGPFGGNVALVMDFVVKLCLDKKEQNFVIYAKQIIVFLSKTPAGARVVDHLLQLVVPKHMVPDRMELMPAVQEAVGLPYVADLTLVLPGGARQHPLSLGQLSMILLVDLIVSPSTLSMDSLPAILQMVLVQWDQNIVIVQEQARELLVHVIHELVISKIEPDSTKPDKRSIEDFVESVRSQDPKTVWSYGDTEVGMNVDGRAVSVQMSAIVEEIVKIFSVINPDIQEQWGRVAMEWAGICTVRHIACRSFQIFRCISSKIDKSMLKAMLNRLAVTTNDDEYQSNPLFSLEILTTLRTAIADLTSEDLLQHPQFFWATCACLDTTYECEFQEGLNMLDLLLSKLDLSDPSVVDIIIARRPVKWEGNFHGVHALVEKGIRSSLSMQRSFMLMERLIKLSPSEISGFADRILFTVLANLPRFLHHFEDTSFDPSCVDSANAIASAADSQNYTSLSRTLQSFAMARYRHQKDFLAQCMAAIRATYFPRHEFESLVFLLGMVNNGHAWFKVKTMQVLQVLIADMDMRKPEITSQGPDLISPLLRLLQTEHCQQALMVLDNVLDMTGTSLDHRHLRMSMAGSHSSRATRKEYDRTKSLYGIPDESGWSVPMPAIRSEQTRYNIQAIANTIDCGSVDDSLDDAAVTPEIEFENEEDPESYFNSRAATMLSDETKVDGNMTELATKLDDLDDFFDEDGDTLTSMDSNGEYYPSGSIEERENLYDQQALPLLHRSLNRNPSVSSFQTGFNESTYPPSREPAMNPAAFAPNGSVPARPGLHNRSNTSPVMVTKKALPLMRDETISSEEPDSFSDDELSLGRSHTTEETPPTHNDAKAGGLKAGFRQGLRRLTSTGGRGEAREALKPGLPAKSPKVPKVPVTYLNHPMSAEL